MAEHAYTARAQAGPAGDRRAGVRGRLAQMLWQTPVQSPAELARELPDIVDREGAPGPVRGLQPRDPGRRLLSGPGLLGRRRPAIDLGLLVLILKLDADYLEVAAAISQKLYERMQRCKQGGGVALPASKKRGDHPPGPRFPGWAVPGRWRGGNC